MSCTSVVRIGSGASSPDGGGSVSAKLLREAVLSYFARKQAQPPSSSTDNNTLTITNKYFQAKVLLQELGTSSPSKDDASSSSLLQEDGVLLVFDSLKSNPDLTIAAGIGDTTESFDALAAVHDQAEAQGTCGDLLRMVVGVTLSSGLSPQELRGTNHEAEYSRRILFCLDRGYEYVEVDLSQEGQAKGHDEREKEGFARVIEALEGTVWSSAVMSKSKTQELKESYQEEAEKVQDTQEEEENPYEPPDPSKFAPVPSPNDKNVNVEKEPIDPTDMLLDPEQASSEDIQKLRQDMEAEQVFEQMEGLLRQANRVREQSKAGELTDEERRQRAGDAATALMNLMSAFGLDDEDDGDDDDDGSDSSSVADKDDENDDSVVKQTETEATKV